MTAPDPTAAAAHDLRTDLRALRARLLRFALREARDPHAAEDAVQETLIALGSAPDAWRGDARYDVYAIGILKHKIADLRRARWREDATDPAVLDELRDDAGEASEAGERPGGTRERERFWASLRVAIGDLPVRTRAAFVLREVQEWDTRSVCDHLGVTPTHLAVLTHRARAHLKLRLRADLLRPAA